MDRYLRAFPLGAAGQARIDGMRRQVAILTAEAMALRAEARALPPARAAVVWAQHDEVCRQMNVLTQRLVVSLGDAIRRHAQPRDASAD